MAPGMCVIKKIYTFLSTKSLTAIAMAALYDDGLLSYDARFHQTLICLTDLLLGLQLSLSFGFIKLYQWKFESESTFTFTLVRIADYWPEFGQKGKEKTTVADLMRHEV